MVWRDWFGYPGMLEDENNEKLVEILQIMTENSKVISEAIIDLQQRVRKLESLTGHI